MGRTLRVSIAALALSLLAACGGGSSGDSASGPIKVGGWIALSGPVAATGTSAAAGTQTYFDLINANGGINGRKVEWTKVDDAFDPQQTIQVARALIQQDEVVAIVGALGSVGTEAAFPFVLQQSKVPIVGPYAGLSSWFTPPRDGLWGMFPLNDDQTAAAGAWAVEDGAKKVAIVRSDGDSFKIAAAATQKVVEAAGGSVVDVVSKIGSTDFSPSVAKVKAEQPDAIVVLLTVSDAATYLKEAANQGVTLPTYGWTTEVSNSLIDLAGKAAEGFHGISASKPPTSDDPEVKEYRDALAKYAPKEKPDFNSLISFAYAKAFAQVVKTIDGPVDATSIDAAFAKASNIETGLVPPISFSASKHQGSTKVARVVIKDGAWEQVGDFVDTPKH